MVYLLTIVNSLTYSVLKTLLIRLINSFKFFILNFDQITVKYSSSLRVWENEHNNCTTVIYLLSENKKIFYKRDIYSTL